MMTYDKQLTETLKRYYQKGVHFDGRALGDVRELVIERGVSKNAEGSARVQLGGTIVYAGVKMQTEKPYPDTPNKGNLMVNAELTPMASPDFESGPPSDWAIEISRLVDRTIREGEALDLKSLCITPTELVWGVIIDVVPINDDGNLLDAASIAAISALMDARFPSIDDKGVIDYKTHADQLPLASNPILVTAYKIGDHIVTDPGFEEERGVQARLSIGFQDDGALCALQKGGIGGLTPEEIAQALEKARAVADVYRKALKVK
jgi:exosome complex component RRP42